MMGRGRCPSPAEIERVYWIAREDRPLPRRDSALHEHVLACETCGEAWNEITNLAAIGGKIEPSPTTWERREEIRTMLLSKMEHDREDGRAPSPPLAWRRFWLAPLAVAAFSAIWWAWPTPAASPNREVAHAKRRGVVLEHDAARTLVVAEQPDEIVRLVDGTITVTVAALGANERFRVITRDDEIDVASDAAFDVTARGDRLTAVRVLHGQVKLLSGGDTKTLRAGETWRSANELAAVDPITQTVSASTRVATEVEPAPSTPPNTPPAIRTHAAPPDEPAHKPSEPPTPPADRAVPDRVAPDAPVDAPPPTPIAPPPPRSMAQQAFDEGWVALRAGDFSKAATAFDRVPSVTHDPHVIEDATFWRAVALARAGEVATAVHVLSAFVRAYPQSGRVGEANATLGWLLFERGDRATAKNHFEAAARDPSTRVRDSARKGLAEVAKRAR